MKTQVKTITPAWAAKVLETRNPKNRPLSLPFVDRLAGDIKANAFATTHQGIAFDINGDLLDGQHRLAAIVKAGIPVQMVVTTDLQPTHKLNGVTVNTFELIDAGRKRGVAQMLQMAGFTNANRQAAIVRVLVNMSCSRGKYISITTAQTHKALYYLKDSPSVISSITTCNGLCRPPAGVAAAITYWHTFEPDAATEFAHELCGITGKAKSPTRAIATWLRRHEIGGGSNAVQCASVCASGIYHYKQGNQLEKIYPSKTAADWLFSLNPNLTKQLASIV